MAKASKKIAAAAQAPIAEEVVAAAAPAAAEAEAPIAEDAAPAPAQPKQLSAVPAELVKQIKQNLGEGSKMTQKDVKAVAEAFVRVLIGQVKEGHSVSLTNHVTFKRALRADRTHKNPKTGEEVFKKAHYVLTMEVKPALKKAFEALEVVPAGGAPAAAAEEAAPAPEAAAAEQQ